MLSHVVTAGTGPAPRRSGDREALRILAHRALEGKDAFIDDGMFHGVLVRLFTTSHHLADFWSDYAWTPGEWLEWTGERPPAAPAISMYAVSAAAEDGLYEFDDEIFLFNRTWFGDLRDAVRAAVQRKLEPRGIRIESGSAAELNGRGIICLGPPGSGRTSALFALGGRGARWIADDAVVIRNKHAYPFEKGLYLRTSMIAHFPEHAAALLPGKFENAPEAPEVSWIPSLEADLRDLGLPKPELRRVLSRMVASETGRTMSLPSKFFRRARGPLDGVPIRAAVALRRDPNDPTVLVSASERHHAPSYDVNMVLARPERRGGMAAMGRLLERLLAETPREARYTTSDYERFAGGP